MTEPDRAGFLTRIGLGRPELRAWAMYDWANSAFVLTQTTLFPVFWTSWAAVGLTGTTATERYSWTLAAGALVVALIAPVLGALADVAGIKKRLLAAFLGLGIAATIGLFFVERGSWALTAALIALATMGAQGSFVFYDALLPHVARDDEIDRVSTTAYALGYVGSSILLAIQLAWITRPAAFGLPEGSLPVRLAFLSVAVWWLLFSLPLFRRVPEPPRRVELDERPSRGALRVAVSRLGETFRELHAYRQAFRMLLAFLVYNDGIGTIIKFAILYGTDIGLGRNAMIAAILVTQLIGVPFAILFGQLAGRIGPRPAILLGLLVYIAVTTYAFFIDSAVEFFAVAVVVGMVQGGCQALSRSLFASLIPRHKTAEFFGFYGVLDKFAGVIGPVLFGLAVVLTGSTRYAVLSVLVFFVVGAVLLLRVRVEEGRLAARQAERSTLPMA